MVILTIVLVVWGIVLQAPLEQPASFDRCPQPVEGPLVLPRVARDARLLRSLDGRCRAASMIIVGLMAIPYIDTNKAGNGYFDDERPLRCSLGSSGPEAGGSNKGNGN